MTIKEAVIKSLEDNEKLMTSKEVANHCNKYLDTKKPEKRANDVAGALSSLYSRDNRVKRVKISGKYFYYHVKHEQAVNAELLVENSDTQERKNNRDIKKETENAKELIRDIHKEFKNGKPLTEEQLERLVYIFDDKEQFGLSCNSHLGMAYLDFCFNNSLSDDEIQMKISALYDFIKQTGKSPMSEEQLGYFVKFLQMGWEDVAIAYLDFCNNGGVSLEFSENEN